MVVEQIVNSIFKSNTFLLREDGDTDYWLVDIGDIKPVLNMIPNGGRIRGVFLTHSHFDHIYGLNDLVKCFPDCLVFTSFHGNEGLLSDKLNCSRYSGTPFVYEGGNVQILDDGDSVSLSHDCVMTAYATPGHDWSCLTYKAGNAVFCGDSHLPGVKVFTKLVKSNKDQAVVSENRILELSQGCVIYSGHGEVVENRIK